MEVQQERSPSGEIREVIARLHERRKEVLGLHSARSVGEGSRKEHDPPVGGLDANAALRVTIGRDLSFETREGHDGPEFPRRVFGRQMMGAIEIAETTQGDQAAIDAGGLCGDDRQQAIGRDRLARRPAIGAPQRHRLGQGPC